MTSATVRLYRPMSRTFTVTVCPTRSRLGTVVSWIEAGVVSRAVDPNPVSPVDPLTILSDRTDRVSAGHLNDGIIAGAPANFWTHLLTAAVFDMQATLTDPGSYIPSRKLPAIQAAVLSACDALDGVKDGVIENPAQCHFEPDTLCAGDRSPTVVSRRPKSKRLLRSTPGLEAPKANKSSPAILQAARLRPAGGVHGSPAPRRNRALCTRSGRSSSRTWSSRIRHGISGRSR
jgi:hypothetical protein